MRIEFTNTENWKDAIQELLVRNIDFATGTIEKPFVVLYDSQDLEEDLVSCGFAFNPYANRGKN